MRQMNQTGIKNRKGISNKNDDTVDTFQNGNITSDEQSSAVVETSLSGCKTEQ